VVGLGVGLFQLGQDGEEAGEFLGLGGGRGGGGGVWGWGGRIGATGC